MREENSKAILAVLFFLLVVVFSIVVVDVFTKYNQNKLNDSCKNLGYEKYVRLELQSFCIDNEGYYYKVSRRNYEVLEPKFREEVLK